SELAQGAGVARWCRACPAHTYRAMVTLAWIHDCRRFRHLAHWLLAMVANRGNRRRDMNRALRGVVADRVKALQQLDFGAIKALPGQSKESVPSLGKIAIIRYHEVAKTGEHLVVVQALRQRWFGLST